MNKEGEKAERERVEATKIAMAVINAFRVGQITLVWVRGGSGVGEEVAGCTLYLIALCVLLLLRILTCCRRRLMPAAHL